MVLIRQLEYFVALSKELNFSQAAKICFVSQPALSESIKKLESELHTTLVQRNHKLVRLTDDGERVLYWAQRILADYHSLKSDLAAQPLTGVLKIGAIPSAMGITVRLIEKFNELYPQVTVNLEANLSNNLLIQKIHNFELEIGIIYTTSSGHKSYPDLQERLICREKQILFVPEKLLPQTNHTIENLLTTLPLCLLNSSMNARNQFDCLAEVLHLTIKPKVETNSLSDIISLVQTGRYSAILPSTTTFSPHDRIRKFDIGSSESILSCITRADGARSPFVRAFTHSLDRVKLS